MNIKLPTIAALSLTAMALFLDWGLKKPEDIPSLQSFTIERPVYHECTQDMVTRPPYKCQIIETYVNGVAYRKI